MAQVCIILRQLALYATLAGGGEEIRYALGSSNIHDQHETLMVRSRYAVASCTVPNHTLLSLLLLQYHRPQGEPSNQLALQPSSAAFKYPARQSISYAATLVLCNSLVLRLTVPIDVHTQSPLPVSLLPPAFAPAECSCIKITLSAKSTEAK